MPVNGHMTCKLNVLFFILLELQYDISILLIFFPSLNFIFTFISHIKFVCYFFTT